MGLFVVGRLAARHGVKVRLQPDATGGLTALVWLPDAIVVLPDTRVSADLGAEREARASSVRPAPTPADLIPRQPSPPASVTAFDQPPRHARAAGPQRPALRLRPVRAPARRQPPGGGAATADHPARVGDDAGVAPVPAASQVEDPADERRLPIYEAVESDWFGNRRTPAGGAAAAGSSGRPAADRGWDAARTVLTPSSSGVTTAGLPVRVPRANLVPGTIGDPPSDAPAPARSADATRDRLSGFQRGASQGRAAVNQDGQEKSS
jgi:hypothetical protein